MTDFHPPAPFGAVPSQRQLDWHGLEYYGFVHFTVNTFTDMEWGRGDEAPAVFDPTDFNAAQIAETAALGGMKGLILTAKHHDGFCLWPSRYTEHSVKNSPWKGGKGDVVAELAEACAKQGLKFGVYLSPWDRNHPQYARPEYLDYYRSQLRELLSQYGPLFEVWFDGANGGDGYYGGQYERREIDARTYYEWERTLEIVRALQPEACVFNVPGGDIRWVGNEDGIAGDPCWHTFNLADLHDASPELLNIGQRDGDTWLPAEVDVSIRPGWFYHEHEDERVRTPENLLELYFQSVGRGGNLLLNLPPTRQGQIHQRDRESLIGFRRMVDDLFAADLARGAAASASSIRGGAAEYSPANLIDGKRDTYWCAEDADRSPWMELRFTEPVRFSVVNLREYLPLGQRVERFALDIWQDGDWVAVYSGTGIGNRRLVRVPAVSTAGVRLRIIQPPVSPAIAEVGLFYG
jgi:alpha-L-fucosidase